MNGAIATRLIALGSLKQMISSCKPSKPLSKTTVADIFPAFWFVITIYGNKGLSIDLKRLRRLMREHGLFHRFHRKYIQTTDSEHDLVRSPNLLQRHFDDFGINEAWCGDITYLPTHEGWLYLASVIGLGTRRLVGYSFGGTHGQTACYGRFVEGFSA